MSFQCNSRVSDNVNINITRFTAFYLKNKYFLKLTTSVIIIRVFFVIELVGFVLIMYFI